MSGTNASGDREVSVYDAYRAMLAFIDNELPRIRRLLELKAILVIWRKTYGWGKFVEEIGAAEFAKRAGADKERMKEVLADMPAGWAERRQKITEKGKPVKLRTRYGFPLAREQQATLACDRQATLVRKKGATPSPPTGATQSNTESRSEDCGTSKSSPTHFQSHRSNVGGRSTDEPRKTFTQEERGWMTRALGSFGQRVQMRRYMGQEPPEVIVEKSLKAADGVDLQDVGDLLRRLCLKGFEPGSATGPKGWGWFVAVIDHAVKKHREGTGGGR
jgi:hypothetical protein